MLAAAGCGLLAVVRAQPAAAPKAAGPLPDLSVAYISIAPRYPSYEVEYADELPQPLHPESGKPLSPEEADKIQRWPRTGEMVTATARVVNHGQLPAGAFTYTWLLDGKRASGGRHPGLAANCEARAETLPVKLSGATLQEAPLREGTFVDLSFPFRWLKKGRRLELQVRLESGQEVSDENNSRTEQTDSWSLAVAVHRRAYNAWAKLRTPGGGSGFEDWLQDHLQALRAKLDQSVYPGVPAGTQPQLRLDQVVVLDDAEDLHALEERRAPSGWDCAWAYPDRREPELDARRTDWTVIKSWGRLLGLIDLNALAVDPSRNQAREPETGQRIDRGYLVPGSDPMGVPGDQTFSEHNVLALNSQAGKRRGYDGIQLYAVPRLCRVRVLDNNSRPVAGAAVTVYQAEAGRLLGEAVAAGKTDANGTLALPNRPAPVLHTEPGYVLQPNPFGVVHHTGDNGLLLLRVAARDQVEYQWLSVLDCNVAYWHGQTSQATFDLHTRLPASHTIDPPAGLRARLYNAQQFRTILLEWNPAPETQVGGYFIYRAAYPTFQFEKIGSTSSLRTRFADPVDADSLPGDRVRYAVTAVDQQGNESGLGKPLLLSLVGESP